MRSKNKKNILKRYIAVAQVRYIRILRVLWIRFSEKGSGRGQHRFLRQ